MSNLATCLDHRAELVSNGHYNWALHYFTLMGNYILIILNLINVYYHHHHHHHHYYAYNGFYLRAIN